MEQQKDRDYIVSEVLIGALAFLYIEAIKHRTNLMNQLYKDLLEVQALVFLYIEATKHQTNF
jgi:hypothetical protein